MLDLLKGLRVVDASNIVMGPMAGQSLGDFGAEVIKLEPPTGDLSRTAGSLGPDGNGALFANNNRNKQSLVIDLKKPEAGAILSKLLATTDVFLHNMRPKAAARLGLDAKTIRASHPGIIHCTACGFGSDGPYSGRPAYDDIIQAAGGLAALPTQTGRKTNDGSTGGHASEPTYVPSIMADKIGAMHVVQAILAALIKRSTSGQGCELEVPMFECLTAFLMNEHLDGASFAEDGKPGYGRLLNPHRRPYATADGWLAVMPYNEGHWRRTFEAMGETDLPQAPWFTDPAGRNARSSELYERLGRGLLSRTTDDWIGILESIDIPHAKVASLSDLLDDPHLAATGFFNPSDGLPGRRRSVPMPQKFHNMPKQADTPPPLLGKDSEHILTELGYTTGEISVFANARVVTLAE